MQYRRRLRSRIILSFALFGIGLTALFAGATLVLRVVLENQLIEETLQREVDRAVEINRVSPEIGAGIPFQKIRGVVYGSSKFANIPFDERLDTGVYDIAKYDEGGVFHQYKLAVHKADDLWAFLWYDVTTEARSREVLFWAVLLALVAFSALSLGIAIWLSKRVLEPVTDLVDRVRALTKSGKPEALAPHFAPDEVGLLAATLDDHARRLTALVERDREFNADVSHELRTPLAVIRGATELLLAQEDLPEKTGQRLKRIERAVRQSGELTEALLLLSRSERAPRGEAIDIATISEVVVDTYRNQLGTKPVSVRVERESPVAVAAPRAVLAVALGNLIGNAFKYTAEGEVVVRIGDGKVQVEDTGIGIKPEDAKRLFERGVRGESAPGHGAGLGLAIVRRLCELYDWRVTLAPGKEGGTVATLAFT